MPIYPRKCLSEPCDHVFELVLAMAAYDPEATHPCPKCGHASIKTFLPAGSTANPDPVIVFKAADGTFRYPGDATGLSAANYEKLGYERVEIRGWADMRRFERTVNGQQRSEIARRVERQLEVHEAQVKMRRSEAINGLRNGFTIPELDERGVRTGRMKTVRMSAQGADIMRACMERNDNKPRTREFEAGFHSDVYNNSRGNRDDSRRSDGRRFRD
jgi:hypothetical protein